MRRFLAFITIAMLALAANAQQSPTKHRRRAQQADDARLQSFLRRQLSVYDLSLRHRYGQQSRLLHVAWIPIQQLSLFWRRHRV